MHSPIPVSYTHLDVGHRRQTVIQSVFHSSQSMVLWTTAGKVSLQAWKRKEDVYKRQGMFLFYTVGNVVLLIVYWIIWMLFFQKQDNWKRMALAIIPTGGSTIGRSHCYNQTLCCQQPGMEPPPCQL